MPPTTTSEFGDVVLVPFPFTDQSTTKKRPAVVVSSADYNARRPDVIVAAVSSRVRMPSSFGEVTLGDWMGAGLLAPSVVKPVLATIEKGLILRHLGRLGGGDLAALDAVLRRLLFA
jgi:mRNA interferase MazF